MEMVARTSRKQLVCKACAHYKLADSLAHILMTEGDKPRIANINVAWAAHSAPANSEIIPQTFDNVWQWSRQIMPLMQQSSAIKKSIFIDPLHQHSCPVEEQWTPSHPTAYLVYLQPDTTRTGTDYHQEMEQARLAHLEAAARWEDQCHWNRQPHEEAERRESAASDHWEAQIHVALVPGLHMYSKSAQGTQPSIAKKADPPPKAKRPLPRPLIAKKADPPPKAKRPLPSPLRYRNAPLMIGTTGPVHLRPEAPIVDLPTSTPINPAHPPRPHPPLPIGFPAEAVQAPTTMKHSLPQPAQEAPRTKQIRWKPFPRDEHGNPIVPLPADGSMNVPLGGFAPKGPPAVPYDPEIMLPTSFEAQQGFAVTVPAQASRPPSPCAGRCKVDRGPNVHF